MFHVNIQGCKPRKSSRPNKECSLGWSMQRIPDPNNRQSLVGLDFLGKVSVFLLIVVNLFEIGFLFWICEILDWKFWDSTKSCSRVFKLSHTFTNVFQQRVPSGKYKNGAKKVFLRADDHVSELWHGCCWNQKKVTILKFTNSRKRTWLAGTSPSF